MTDQPAQPAQRSYGCSYGCGNPYDFILITVSDSTTEFLCLPCLVHLAGDLVEAVVNPDNPEVQRKMSEAGEIVQAPMTGDAVPERGHNAPIGTDDEDLITEFSDVITVDQLPEAFR